MLRETFFKNFQDKKYLMKNKIKIYNGEKPILKQDFTINKRKIF